MLDDKSESCNEDPNYKKDDCIEDVLEKFIMKEYGCTPPFFENKECICTNETISKQVLKYWESAQYDTNCSDPCKVISVKSRWMKYKIRKESAVKLYFHKKVKVVKSYHAYSGLSLIAEIGGYCGLFLGVSINQVTYLTSFVLERVQKYI